MTGIVDLLVPKSVTLQSIRQILLFHIVSLIVVSILVKIYTCLVCLPHPSVLCTATFPHMEEGLAGATPFRLPQKRV